MPGGYESDSSGSTVRQDDIEYSIRGQITNSTEYPGRYKFDLGERGVLFFRPDELITGNARQQQVRQNKIDNAIRTGESIAVAMKKNTPVGIELSRQEVRDTQSPSPTR